RYLVNGALFGGAAIAVLPLLWMLSVSFMAPGAASSLPPPLLPAHPTLGNYRELFAHAGMGRYVLNSLFISGAIALFALVCNLMAGYAFAKLRFVGRERLFQLLKYAGLVNSYAGVIVPGMATIFGIYLVREYARGVPDELLEAARIDGAGEWRIFGQIVLPLLKPVMVTLTVLTFLAAWNDFMWPLIVLTGQEHYT